MVLIGCAQAADPDQATGDTASAGGIETVGPSEETLPSEEVLPSEEALPSDDASVSASAEQLHPDVVDAELTEDGDGTFTAAVTLSSPYDTPERYADAWRVLSPDREELGIRPLAHHHANEQPFIRSQSGIEIPEDVSEVVIQGRDQANGWGGAELTVPVPGR